MQVAVVGAGAAGAQHARIYAEAEGVELAAVVDVRRERAQALASRFGARALTDHRRLGPEIKAASLAVPTVVHAQLGCDLLGRGLHLLVEKPLASSVAEANQLIEAQKQARKVLQVGHSERFNPAVTAVRSLVKRPRFFEGHRLGVFVGRSLDIDVVLDLMIHDLDLVLSMVDHPVREIRAVGMPVLTPRIDIANARIEFEGGCVANLTASRVSGQRIRKLRLFQPHDYFSIDLQSQEVQIYSLSGSDSPRIVQRRIETETKEPLLLEIEAFLAEIHHRPVAYPGCSGLEGRKVLQLALDLRDQMKKNS